MCKGPPVPTSAPAVRGNARRPRSACQSISQGVRARRGSTPRIHAPENVRGANPTRDVCKAAASAASSSPSRIDGVSIIRHDFSVVSLLLTEKSRVVLLNDMAIIAYRTLMETLPSAPSPAPDGPFS